MRMLVSFLAMLTTPAMASETVYLEPGECSYFEHQKVCAEGSRERENDRTLIYRCRYKDAGELKPSESGMKNYVLELIILKDGKRQGPIPIQSFYPTDEGKKNCQGQVRVEHD